MAQPNPFRTRHSEAASRNLALFTATFAPEVLHALPAPPFEQFYVLRSAPGAGKTSLMKCFTAETLSYVHRHRSRATTLVSFLTEFGVLGPNGPLVVGVLENLDQNYAGLLDIAKDSDLRRRLLFRLLDARIIQGIVRSSLEFVGRSATSDPDLVQFLPKTPGAKRDFARLGGTSGADLITEAESAEEPVGCLVALAHLADAELVPAEDARAVDEPEHHAPPDALAAEAGRNDDRQPVGRQGDVPDGLPTLRSGPPLDQVHLALRAQRVVHRGHAVAGVRRAAGPVDEGDGLRVPVPRPGEIDVRVAGEGPESQVVVHGEDLAGHVENDGDTRRFRAWEITRDTAPKQRRAVPTAY